MFGSDIRAYCRGSGKSRSGDLTSFGDIYWLSHASSVYPGAFKRRAYDLSYHCNDFIITKYLKILATELILSGMRKPHQCSLSQKRNRRKYEGIRRKRQEKKEIENKGEKRKKNHHCQSLVDPFQSGSRGWWHPAR